MTGFLYDVHLGLTNAVVQSPYLHTGYLCSVKVRGPQIFDVNYLNREHDIFGGLHTSCTKVQELHTEIFEFGIEIRLSAPVFTM